MQREILCVRTEAAILLTNTEHYENLAPCVVSSNFATALINKHDFITNGRMLNDQEPGRHRAKDESKTCQNRYPSFPEDFALLKSVEVSYFV